MKTTSLSRATQGALLPLMAVVLVSGACGSGGGGAFNAGTGNGAGTGGVVIGSTGGGVQAGSGGRTATGGRDAGQDPGQNAGQPGDPPNPGGAPPGTPCGGGGDDPQGSAMPELCASGRCETMPGIVGPVCLGACFAEGAPCARALDCCSTGCFDGRCAAALCIVEGEACSESAECCSGICGPDGECEVDEPNRECRPTGEDCTGGSGRGCCHECVEEGDRFFDFFDGEKRCGFAPETCFAQGVACTGDADCCRGTCDGGFCRTTCTAGGGACEADADCCGGSCDADSGTCGTPGGCTAVSGECTTGSDCCSGFCFGGFCDSLSIR